MGIALLLPVPQPPSGGDELDIPSGGSPSPPSSWPATSGFKQSETVAYLKGGTLVIAGGHRTVDRFTMPVIGGTGRYEGARGSAAFSPGPQQTESLDVHLLP